MRGGSQDEERWQRAKQAETQARWSDEAVSSSIVGSGAKPQKPTYRPRVKNAFWKDFHKRQ